MAQSGRILMWKGPLGLWRLVRPYWPLLAAALVAMLLESAADVWDPWPLKLIFDNVIGGAPLSPSFARWAIFGTGPLDVLNAAVLTVIAIAALGAIGSYTHKYLSAAVGQRVMYDLRHVLYHHIQRLSLAFFDRHRTGDMVVRLTSDIDAAQDFISSALLAIAVDVVTLGGMFAVMLYLDWRFAILSLLVAPVLFSVVYRRTGRIKKATREVKQRESALASIVQESIAAVRTVKAFAREEYEESRLDRESREAMDAALRARGIKAALPPLVDVIVAGGTCLVLLVGVRLVLRGELTSGTLLVFLLYLGKMYKPMKDLSKMTDTLSKAAVGFERIGELLHTERQVPDRPGARRAPRFAGHVELRHVSFGYVPDHPGLRAVSLTLTAGEHAAIVGPTGSGKSTVLSLLLRLYDPLDGAIRIDGTDIREFSLRSLRDQISLVPQDPVLFFEPIWKNIAYGRPDATRDDIVRAAVAANAHEFITGLPQGYDTIVGERGETLSGGQRQRIAIARALVRNTPILLLDEPSASLDAESEALVFEALSHLMEGRTSITIAHRLSTVRRATRIYVLDDGRVTGAGSHDELLVTSALYRRLAGLQFVDRQAAATSSDAVRLGGSPILDVS